MASVTAGTIEVVAVVLQDAAGRVLTVRKQGTARFMLVGGKPEPREPLAAAAVRETLEEVGLRIDAHQLVDLGVWRGAAANETDHLLVATLFEMADPVDPDFVAASGEIAELRWLDPSDSYPSAGLAPLLTEHVLPLLHSRLGQPSGRRPRGG